MADERQPALTAKSASAGTGWDALREPALRRLKRRFQSPASQPKDAPFASESPAATAGEPREDQPATKRESSPCGARPGGATQATNQAEKPRQGARQRIASGADALQPGFVGRKILRPAGALEDQKQTNGKISGLVVSAALHVVLVLLLAWATVNTPSPSAGLRLAAVAPQPIEPVTEMQLEQPVEEALESEDVQAVEMPGQPDVSLASVEVSAAVPVRLGRPAAMSLPSSDTVRQAQETVGSGRPTGGASFFGAASGGNCFCFVIDVSGSMRGDPWEAARRELLRALFSLKPDQRFYVILFNSELAVLTEPGTSKPAAHAVYATRENLQHARRWLMSARIGGGGAAPKECIRLAIEKEPDAIYLLTDGVTRVKDVAEYIRTENRVSDVLYGERVRVPIHTIAFYSDQGIALLRQIARENRGQFAYVAAPR